MVSKLLENGTVISFDDAAQAIKVLPRASVLVVDDYIAAITEARDTLSVPSDAEIIDVQGRIVAPGFINTHTHVWQTVYRTAGPNTVLVQYFDWLSNFSAKATEAFEPDDIYISCLEGYLEGLNAGVTSYVEHATNNWNRKVVRPGYDAATDSGARVWWCYDICPKPEFCLTEHEEILTRIAATAVSPSVELGLGLDGFAVSGKDDLETHLKYIKGLMGKLNLKALTVHHMGGPWPQGNKSPTMLCEQGFPETSLPVIFSHAPYLTGQDMNLLRKHDLFISITPESECHFGHGQDTGRLISDQASIGVDTNWTFSGDILTQARLWLQTVRSTNYQRTLRKGVIPNQNPMAVAEAFLLATRQGARALRRHDIGVLQVGAKADIVVFNGDSPNMLGWSDPVAAVMLHANVGDIEHVLVNGEFRKRDFKLVNTTLRWNEVKKRFTEASKRIQSQVQSVPPLPDKFWGVGELGDVETVSCASGGS